MKRRNSRHKNLRLRPFLYMFLAVLVMLGMERVFYIKEMAVIKEEVVIVEGENPSDSNYRDGGGYISNNFGFMGDRALQLSAHKEVPGGYYFEYLFYVPANGDYNIVFCGTPPGPKEQGSPWNSPYSVSLDNAPATVIYEEDIQENWPVFERFNYVKGGYYFVKIMTARLAAGDHTIKITVDKPRVKDGAYTVYLDAIIISPKGYIPFVSTKKLPRELFEAL